MSANQAANPNAFRVYTGVCPDPACKTKLYFPSYASSSVECTGCGQHHARDTLLDVQLVQDPELAVTNLLRSVLLTRPALRKEAELVRVRGFSNYHCKLLAPFLTKYGMDRSTGKAKLLKEMGQGDCFDCSHFGNRAFLIEPDFLETSGYGKDRTGSLNYLQDTLSALRTVNNSEDRLIPLHVDGDGHCLVHAVSRALTGREIFWHALRTNLQSHLRHNLQKYQALFRDFIHQSDWMDIVNEAGPEFHPADGEPLGLRNIHIFGLANVLHRPILLLDRLAGMQSSGDYSATFLPAMVPIHECKSKDGKLNPPLAIAWSSSGRNHYIPLVGVAGKAMPRLPQWLIPKAWGIPNELAKAYIQFDGTDCCIIGGDHVLQEKYVQRLMKAMDEQFYQIHGVVPSLVTDVHQFLYKPSGLVGILLQTVIDFTKQSVQYGHLEKCLSCHAISENKPPVNQEWLLPGGEMYRSASQTAGGLIEGQMYTFPRQELTCCYNEEKDKLQPVKYKGVMLSECNLCKGALRLVQCDGSVVYKNGDRTTTPVQGQSSCTCGYKHYWDGKEYDNLPQVIPVMLEWGGKTIKETVHWFQNETNVTLNSNVYEVATQLVQKYFPGEFGSERLVQKVVDTILRQTARKEGENKGARPDIPGLAAAGPSPSSPSSSSAPGGPAIEKYVPSKIILTGEKKKTFHKEELTMSEAERLVKARTEHHAAVTQKKRSNAQHALKKTTPEKVPTPPKQMKEKQATSSPSPTNKIPSSPRLPASPRSDKKIRLSSSKGGQAMLTLPLTTTYSQLQEAIHKELGIDPEHQKIRYGFPPRPLNPPDEGKEEEPAPIQHGDRVMVEVLVPPENPPLQQQDVEMVESQGGDAVTSAEPTQPAAPPVTSQQENQMDVDSNTAALASALMNALSGALGNDMWEAASRTPTMFNKDGFYYNLVQNDLGPLKDDQHCTIPHLPGKLFAYSKENDRLELCMGKIHVPVQPLTPELIAQAQAAQATATSGTPSSQGTSGLTSEASFSGAISHRDSSRARVAFSGQGRSLTGGMSHSPAQATSSKITTQANQSALEMSFPLPRTLRQPPATASATTATNTTLIRGEGEAMDTDVELVPSHASTQSTPDVNTTVVSDREVVPSNSGSIPYSGISSDQPIAEETLKATSALSLLGPGTTENVSESTEASVEVMESGAVLDPVEIQPQGDRNSVDAKTCEDTFGSNLEMKESTNDEDMASDLAASGNNGAPEGHELYSGMEVASDLAASGNKAPEGHEPHSGMEVARDLAASGNKAPEGHGPHSGMEVASDLAASRNNGAPERHDLHSRMEVASDLAASGNNGAPEGHENHSRMEVESNSDPDSSTKSADEKLKKETSDENQPGNEEGAMVADLPKVEESDRQLSDAKEEINKELEESACIGEDVQEIARVASGEEGITGIVDTLLASEVSEHGNIRTVTTDKELAMRN